MILERTPIFVILLMICFLQIFPTNCIFPLERDVAKMTGLSLSKTWMIFMEKRAWACGNNLSRQRSSALMDFFICLTFRNNTSKVCLETPWDYRCSLRFEEPNIIRSFSGRESLYRTINIKVHQQFHINGTVSRFRYVTYRKIDETKLRLSENFMELILNGSKHRYSGNHYPWSFLNAHHSLSILFNFFHDHEVNLEYNIIQKEAHLEYIWLSGKSLSYTNERYRINCVYIRVDVRARVALTFLSCLSCKSITYDGPNELLPVILNISKSLMTPIKLLTSTFQALIVVIHEHETSTMCNMSYQASYRSQNINFTKETHKNLIFDNSTNCDGYSFQVRSCVHVISSSVKFNFQLSIKKLSFYGIYRGSSFAAGMLVLTDNGKSVETICELYDSIFLDEHNEFNITITGTRLYVVMYAYTVYAHLSVNLIISASECVAYFVTKYSWLYVPFDKSPNQDKTYTMNSTKFIDYANGFCMKIYLIQVEVMESSQYSDIYHFLLHVPMPIMITLNVRKLSVLSEMNPNAEYHVGEYFGLYHLTEGPINKPNYDYVKYVGTAWDIWVNARKSMYYEIVFQSVSCLIPRQWLGLGNNLSLNNTVNICENYYITCRSSDVYLKSNATVYIQLLSEHTEGINVAVVGDQFIFLVIFSNITIKTSTTWLARQHFKVIRRAGLTCQENYVAVVSMSSLLPLSRAYTGYFNSDREYKTQFWKGRRYMLQNKDHWMVSWETASKDCLANNDYLLTVNSEDEYNFIHEAFLSDASSIVLFIGMRWKVIHHMAYNIEIKSMTSLLLMFRV